MSESVYYNSPIGILLIKTSGIAITEVSFVDEDINSVTDEIILREPSSQILKKCITQLDDYFSGKLFLFNLNLEQKGTVFQQKVWNELLNIKYGRTMSYLSLSKSIGNQKAIRAVGTANGKNNIAIIVPCHRIIGKDGSLVGYAGGLQRKHWLLDHEAKYTNGVQTLF